MKKRVTLLNMISGLLLELCVLLNGFIIPKIILVNFGSNVNGLISSLNQFLSYITLIEGGITGVVVTSLYKPLVENDEKKLSTILSTANRFFKKIGLIFIIYTLVLAVLYPLLFHTKFDFSYVFVLTIILSINLQIQYMFSLTFKTLLKADKKGYIVNFSQILITVTNIILSVCIIYVYPSVHLLKLVNGIVFLIQPLIFSRFVKKNYNINYRSDIDNSLIKDRWSGFAINVAAFIHNSTDISVLTIFSNLENVSIYSVYALVSNGIKQLINSCLTGVAQTVGHSYAKKDFKDLNIKLDMYEFTVFILVSFLFTVAALLITPFVMIYTKDVSDANYFQPTFAILLLVSEALYLLKFPYLSLAYAANKFRELTIPSYIEAIINIIVSVIFVQKYGVIGVTIGTIIAMAYRMIFQVNYSSKLAGNRKVRNFYKKLILFVIASVVAYFACIKLYPVEEYAVVSWLIHGLVYSVIVGISLLLISFLFFRSELLFLKKYLKKE